MKSLMQSFRMATLLASLFLLLATASTAQAQSNDCNEGRARGAAMAHGDFNDCIRPFSQGPNWELEVQASAIQGTNGCTYEVTAYVCPACRPNQPCLRILCRQLVVAYVDENFNVTSIVCN